MDTVKQKSHGKYRKSVEVTEKPEFYVLGKFTK